MGSDYLVKAMGLGAKLRMIAVRSTLVGQTLRERHKALPTAAAALTRVATACLMMGGLQKGREQVGLQFRGEGILGQVMAIADAKGNVRALVDQPGVDFPSRDDGLLDVGFAIGPGELIVTRSLSADDPPYQGVVPITSGEVGDDLASYFLTSEQKPTAVGVGERIEGGDIKAAGGFLIQAFPGVEDSELEAIEERIRTMPSLSGLLTQGKTPEEILSLLVPDVQVLDRYPVQFSCTCSQERYERILITLGPVELQSMIDEQAGAELCCNFCQHLYKFSASDLRLLLLQSTTPSGPRH